MRRTQATCRGLRGVGQRVMVVALVFAAAVATSPVMVSVELLKAGPWAVSQGAAWLGVGGVNEGLAGGCGCQLTVRRSAGCCCAMAKSTGQSNRARALAMAAVAGASGQCGVPKRVADTTESREREERVGLELPLEGPGWRPLPCRGMEGMLVGVDVRHWQPGEGGPGYPVMTAVDELLGGALVRGANDALAVDAPPPEWV